MNDLHSLHADLVEKFEASEDMPYLPNTPSSPMPPRVLMVRVPAITQNMIKQKIDFLQGLERQQRTVPNALPRTPQHETDAHSASDALKFVADDQRYNKTRSRVWEDILKAGWGAVRLTKFDDARG